MFTISSISIYQEGIDLVLKPEKVQRACTFWVIHIGIQVLFYLTVSEFKARAHFKRKTLFLHECSW